MIQSVSGFRTAWLMIALAAMQPLAAVRLQACGVRALPTGRPIALDGAPRLIWPVHGTLVVDVCADGSERRFKGIDVAVPEGTPVQAAADGVVVYAGDELKQFGKLVIIRHNAEWISAYAFASAIAVARGDQVRRGQTIARSGRVPGSGAQEVHFEVRRGSRMVDPLRLLPPQAALGR